MLSPKHENIIFYLDITGKILKRKDVVKAIVNFIKEKKKKNPLTTFGVLLFKTDGSPDFLGYQNDTTSLIKKIESEWKSRQTNASFLENGLFYALSHIAEKATEQHADHRVIVLSDFPSSKSDEYHDALFELISHVRFIPTFIDIIRIGKERFYSDDVKLRIITTTSSGGLFYVEDSKSLNGTLIALTKNKRLASLNQPEGKIVIDDENKLFYENLASDLLTPEPGETGVCILCKNEECNGVDPKYAGLLKCYNCGSYFHEAHAAVYSFEQNIGLPYIFRCPKCEILLKLDESRTLAINGIEIQEEPEDIPEEITVMEEESEIKTEEEAMNYQYDSPVASNSTETCEAGNNGKRVPLSPGGFSFFQRPIINNESKEPTEIKLTEIKSTGDLGSSNEYWNPEDSETAVDRPQSMNTSPAPCAEESTNLTPSERRRRKRTSKFRLCKVCGASLNSNDTYCKHCGSPAK